MQIAEIQKNFKQIKCRFLHPYLEKRVAGVLLHFQVYDLFLSFQSEGRKTNLSAG